MQIASSTGSEVFLRGIRPYCQEPKVELYCPKDTVFELHRGTVTLVYQLQTPHDDVADAAIASRTQKCIN